MLLSKGQSRKIQVLRGLAIIAVVFIHNTPAGIYQVAFRPFLNFAVGLFLFLSGLLSSADRWNPKKRIVKVIIPYVIWTFVYVASSHIKEPASIPLAYIKGLLAGNSAGIMYYIFVYCEFTLLIPVIDRLAKSKYKYLGFAISPIEIVVFRLIPIVRGAEIGGILGRIINLSCLGWFTYFYLGYLMGNDPLDVKSQAKRLLPILIACMGLQIAEGYWYFTMGVANCGTQVKLSSILTGVVIDLLVYKYIEEDSGPTPKLLLLLGDCSFGIYFSHIAIMRTISRIPYYSEYVVFPLNAMVTVVLSLCFVLAGRKVLGTSSKYLAL